MLDPTLSTILDTAIAAGASDVHIKSGQTPAMRINGAITYMDMPPLTDEEVQRFIRSSRPGEDEPLSINHSQDYSWEYAGVRLRCNTFHDMAGWCMSLRVLFFPNTDFESLRIPGILKQLALRKSGLILITGPTGSGKTTTLTCLIDYLIKILPAHIITIEEPIEYIHKSDKAMISQREIGTDVDTYDQAIVEALREDPDIILIGEMRDKESIAGALRAAETGHLVLSTIHTKGAANSITRIIDVFPTEQQNQIRMQISMSLLGVVSQQLIPRVDGNGRVLATEVMVNTVAVQNLIRTERVHMLSSTMQMSAGVGMHTMKDNLTELLNKGLISRENFDNYQIQ